jgi:protein involved in polysaccharide export with SLBB domain
MSMNRMVGSNVRRPGEVPASAITITLRDAAALSGLSTATLRRRAREGALETRRVGGRRLVVAASLRRLLGAE